MVTASHNPPQDNGYKVYLGDGSQIVPPADAEIAAPHRARSSGVADVPLRRRRLGDARRATLDGLPRRRRHASSTRRAPRDLSIVHTACTASGPATVHEAFVRAGFAAPIAVDEQAEPDPDFPTVAFPNPEEPGAMDLALARARADRAPTSSSPTTPTPTGAPSRSDPAPGAGGCCAATRWAPCSARTSLARGRRRGATSSPTRSCRRGCSRRSPRPPGCGTRRRSPASSGSRASTGLRYGYEEALGYCVDPDLVRDKDGVSAALLLAELAADAQGRGPDADRPARRPRRRARRARHRLASPCASTDLAQIAPLMARLRAEPADVAWPASPCRALDDLAAGDGGLPPTDGLRFLPRRRLAGHRAPERHRAQAQGLPRGHRAGADPGRRSADREPWRRPASPRCAPTWSG